MRRIWHKVQQGKELLGSIRERNEPKITLFMHPVHLHLEFVSNCRFCLKWIPDSF